MGVEFNAIYNRANGNKISKATWRYHHDGWRVKNSFLNFPHSEHFSFLFSFSWHPFRSNTCCSDCCCSIDIWGIALNILLQDAPFLTFRLLIIIHYQIISYMNVFFTCNPSHFCFCLSHFTIYLTIVLGKNTLVILLQLYRLYVVHTENNKSKSKKKKLKYYQDRQRQSRGGRGQRKYDSGDIYIISNEKSSKQKKRLDKFNHEDVSFVEEEKGWTWQSELPFFL